MKRLYWLIIIFVGFDLSGCATTNHPNQAAARVAMQLPENPIKKSEPLKQCAMKNPITIEVYPHGASPHLPYKIIAKESISKYNLRGIKRQEATIHDALRNLAASVGGDAVINVTRDDTHVTGTIIMFDDKRVG